MKTLTLEEASSISVGDLIDIATGPLKGHNAIVEKITRTLNTFAPVSGWYGGPSLLIQTDLGPVSHFQVEGIRVKGWIR